MSKETEKTTGEEIKKNLYTLRTLIKKWLLALFLILLVFPALMDILELTLGLPAKLTYPAVGTGYLFYIVAYTVLFLLKRKEFAGQEKQEDAKDKNKNLKMPSFRLGFSSWENTIIVMGIVIVLISVVLNMRYRGLSITGTMFWNGEPAETVSVILCPAGTIPGASYPLFGIEGGCDEKSVPWTIIDASGKYRFFNILPGEYWIFYKWPDEDDWNLGETTKESYLVLVKEESVAKVDSMFAIPNDWLIEPEGILNYPAVISPTTQKATFRWKSLKDTDHYFIEIYQFEEEPPGKVIFSKTVTVTSPVIEASLPKGELSLRISAYNLKDELVARRWYLFEVK